MANTDKTKLGDWLSSRAVVTHGDTVIIDQTLTITTGGAQGSGDYVGVDHVAMTFTDCARLLGGTGTIPRVLFVDYDLQAISGELWLFDTAPAGLPDDNAAFTITDADAARCIGVVPFNTYYASALNCVSPGVPLTPIVFQCAAASRDLYGAFVTRGTPTYVTAHPTFRLVVWQD